MKKQRRISGFTMAEMLIVVAIIAVLGAVGFVAVQNHQRNMAMLERDTIAKEIFVAAQNHLTLAESQGYLGANLDDKTKKTRILRESEKDLGTTSGDDIAIYDAVYTGGTFSDALNIMLPFGAIDETVRAGGRYVIRYQAKPARVLDVFYWTKDGQFGGTATYDSTMLALGDSGKTDDRKRNSPVIGWFGGETPVISGTYNIKAPSVRVVNEEKLYVVVKDYNTADSDGTMPDLKLIITGDKNKNTKVAFVLPTNTVNRHARVSERKNDEYIIILDDITQAEFHFADLNKILESTDTTASRTGLFDPGEDIVVQAVAYSNRKLSNIAYSNEVTTNSLFAELEVNGTGDDTNTKSLFAPGTKPLAAPDGTIPETGDTTTTVTEDNKKEVTAYIANFRHLENLDKDISNVAFNADNLDIKHAVQITDMDWNDYKATEIGEVDWVNTTIILFNGNPVHSSIPGLYKPVNATYLLSYNGGKEITVGEDTTVENHTVTGVKTNWDGTAGLFGEFGMASVSEGETISISNLTLIDFDIQATGNAGALAGTLTNTTVSDVLAYHNKDFIVNENEYRNITSTGDDGDAGGLVGSMTGGKIEYSAASLYVSAIKNAGGLIGTANGTEKVSYCYSGGHTLNGSYGTSTANTVPGHINVLGGQNVGGLIGEASGKMTVKYCYSTCSVKGSTAGGFIGKATDSDPDSVIVMQNYAGGLVLTINTEGKRGTFLGDGSLKQGADTDTPTNYYVSGINGTLGSGAVDIAGPFEIPDSSTAEHPFNYDDEWDEIYKSYPFKTMEEWAGDTLERKPEFLKIHYGDWSEPKPMGTNLVLTNAEKLTAKVSMPVSELGEGQMLTMLIRGEKSEKTAYLLLALDKKTESEAYSVIPTEKTAIAGIESAKISEWLEKIVVTPDSVSETGSFEMTLTLDSITDQGGHFAEIFPEFIPGENIVVAAKGHEVLPDKMKEIFTDAEDETKLKDMPVKADDTNVLADMTNSLFASINDSATSASIGYFRHLENLDAHISALGKNSDDSKKVAISQATQTRSLKWSDFGSGVQIKPIDGEPSKVDCFLPVNPSHCSVNSENELVFTPTVLNYNGKSSEIPEGGTDSVETTHSITGVKVDNVGNAGLFGSMIDGSSVSNLMLSDFDIKSSGTGDNGNAGALAGVLTGTVVKDVVIGSGTLEDVKTTSLTVETATGNAGGLVGSMSGGSVTNVHIFSNNATVKAITSGNAGGMIGKSDSGSVTNALVHGSGETVTTNAGDAGGLIGSMSGGAVVKSAAAVIVESKAGNAGGLIGTASGNASSGNASISASYSGGHTKNATYYDDSKQPIYNVKGTANAGGLIGNAGNATISNSYSTCSATGATAGGFVGTGTGDISYCYATGLVEGTSAEGAFAASLSKAENCWYYEIINEGMEAIPGETTIVINAIDKDATSYDDFVKAPTTWNPAEPYDGTLKTFFENGFNLKTVDQLGKSTKSKATEAEIEGNFAYTHYGDWPAPEQLVVNVK